MFQLFQFTSYIGENAFWTYDKCQYIGRFGAYIITSYCSYVVMGKRRQIPKFYFFKYFHSTVYVLYEIAITCFADEFGNTCWYKCVSSPRMNCNCQHDATKDMCNIVCKPGWIKSPVKYVLKFTNRTNTILECLTVDLCQKYPCKQNQTCLFIDNTTRACEIFEVSYFSDTGERIESHVLFMDELLLPEVNFNIIKRKIIIRQLNLIIHQDTDVFKYKKVALQISDHIAVRFIDDTIIDKWEKLYFTINLIAWRKNIKTVLKFRLYDEPDSIEYYVGEQQNITLMVDPYVYMNTFVSYKANGRPQFRIVGFWSCPIKFSYPFLNKQKVPIQKILFSTYINVNVSIIAKNRKLRSTEKYQTIYLKEFIYLRWNIKRNILSTTDILICEVLTYVAYDIDIKQISGFTVLNIAIDRVILNSAIDDVYELLCIWKIRFHQISAVIRKRIRILNSPNKMCFLPFPHNQGVLVQCMHSGTPPDEYIVSVSLYLKEAGLDLDSQFNFDYIRIPYILHGNQYIVNCTVKQKDTNIIANKIKDMITIYDEYKFLFSLSQANLDCFQYGLYLESVITNSIDRKQVHMNVPLFFLNLNHGLFSVCLVPIYLVLILCSSILSHKCYRNNKNKNRKEENLAMIRKITNRQRMDEKINFVIQNQVMERKIPLMKTKTFSFDN